MFSQTKLEYTVTEQMPTLFGELRRESSIPGKDIENMKGVLLQAEEQLQITFFFGGVEYSTCLGFYTP